jgi:hypothetical protein
MRKSVQTRAAARAARAAPSFSTSMKEEARDPRHSAAVEPTRLLFFELGEDELLHITRFVPAYERVHKLRLVSHAMAGLVRTVGLRHLMLQDTCTDPPCWLSDGLVLSVGWLRKKPMTPTSTAAANLRSGADKFVDPRLAQYEVFRPQVLTLAPLLSVIEHPARTLPFAKPYSQMLPSVKTIYFASYSDVSNCSTRVCPLGRIPASFTYAQVLSEMRSWTPPEAALAQLGERAPPDHLALMVPVSELGCRCGQPSQFKCASGTCLTQCCAKCSPAFRELGPCGACEAYKCYGHSAVCTECGERYCVDYCEGTLCMANIVFCSFCLRPLCQDCIAHHDCK